MNAVLTTGDTDLGTVVVDAKGMTVADLRQGTPNGVTPCTGGCLGLWRGRRGLRQPGRRGVDGDVGAITRDDGTKRVTLDGYRSTTGGRRECG